MTFTACRKALEQFAGKRILVMGDLMLDEHIWGTVARISPEAPVMVVEVNAGPEDNRPGGAANVANNLRALGAEVSLVGVIGDDEGGRILMDSLMRSGVDVSGVVVDAHRPTTRKTRVWASHRHQVVRVDRESHDRIAPEVMKNVIRNVSDMHTVVDAVLISDYDKGLITPETVQAAILSAKKCGKVSTSNAKPRNLSSFEGVDVLTLNQSEASAASGIEIESASDVEQAGEKIVKLIGCKGLVITRGGHGLSVFEDGKFVSHIPAVESEVYDVAGAGDTVVSALTLALSCGLGLVDAGRIANSAGGAVVRKIGVATTSVSEISELLANMEAPGV